MTSPFPGMDPYLEDPAFWPDFHGRFINAWCEAIADRLPENYEARLDEQFRLMEVDPDEQRRIRPDVAVLERSDLRSNTVKPLAATPTLEPALLTLPEYVEIRELNIEIFHRPKRELVTVIELLSPANKDGPGSGQYYSKRRAVLRENVHLVELDLLRKGLRLPTLEPLSQADYYYFVSRAHRRPKIEVYRWTTEDRLPLVPIPLKQPDPDVLVELATVFATTYERGHYAKSIDYGQQPAV